MPNIAIMVIEKKALERLIQLDLKITPEEPTLLKLQDLLKDPNFFDSDSIIKIGEQYLAKAPAQQTPKITNICHKAVSQAQKYNALEQFEKAEFDTTDNLRTHNVPGRENGPGNC